MLRKAFEDELDDVETAFMQVTLTPNPSPNPNLGPSPNPNRVETAFMQELGLGSGLGSSQPYP